MCVSGDEDCQITEEIKLMRMSTEYFPHHHIIPDLGTARNARSVSLHTFWWRHPISPDPRCLTYIAQHTCFNTMKESVKLQKKI